MINSTYGLMLFSDIQPSEQIEANLNQTYCFASVLCLDVSIIAEFKQYKDTEAKLRPGTAQKLAKILKGNKSIRAVGFIARPDAIERFGNDFLATVPPKAIKKSGAKYKVDKNKLSNKLVKFLPWYALGLCLTGLQGAIWAKNLNIKNVTLIPDRLPVSPASMMELVSRISHHPELFPLWKESEEKYGVKFEISNMESYVDADGITRSGVNHPCMVLADWLAHSMYASSNKAGDLDGIAKRNEEYRQAISEPWFALYNEKRFILVPLERIVLSGGTPNQGINTDA